MKSKTTLHRMFVLLITLMSAIGANAQEAYANYTPSNTTLTFYYDNLRSTRTGTTYDLNTGDAPGWYYDDTNANVTKVVFDPSFVGARPTSTYRWFYQMTNLESIEGICYLNTSEVTNMNSMFSECSSLRNLDLSRFNTSNVTDMEHMFYYCSNLTSLDISTFNTSKVTRMSFMFMGCTNLQTIYAGIGWSITAVGYTEMMFTNCTSLVGGQGTNYSERYVTLSHAHIDGGPSDPGYFTEKEREAYAYYTSSNTTLTFCYDNYRSIREGKTYNLNTDSNAPGWYTDGTNANVTKVVIDPLFADARPTTTYSWFSDMNKLETIEGMNYLNTSMVTNMVAMFKECVHLTNLDLSSFNTSKVTNMNAMFYNCSSLQTIFVDDGWTTAAVTKSNFMFTNCTSLVGGKGTTWSSSNPTDKTYARIDGRPSNPGYFTEKPIETYAYFTSENRTLTFYYDNKRSSRMITGTTYDLNTGSNDPDWYTDGNKSKVAQVVFDPSFADARPTTTYWWFNGMTNLETIEGMNYLNTSEVIDMTYMFGNCEDLTSLDLSSFNTSKVISMYGMFVNCYRLTSLNLSSFNTASVINMVLMFSSCWSLRTIYVGSGWSTTAATGSNYMFDYCNSLVGGQGTSYDENYVDGSYAHIDGGTSNPGYFTAAGTEPYACYTPGNTTLTFYYDNLRGSRGGTTYDLNLNNNYPRWTSDGTYENVTKVVFDSSFAGARPTTTYAWFYGMENLTNITGMSYLNTSKVTNMNQLFYYCSSLKSLDISHFNTSEVTDMGYMFMLCNNLQTIYVGDGWNMAKVTQSTNMFSNCTSLKGSKGTTYNDSNPKDKSYAHIDGEGGPGYFTARTTGIATRIENGQRESVKGQSEEWFTIDGQKLNGMPAKKGVYIQNGKKTVVK